MGQWHILCFWLICCAVVNAVQLYQKSVVHSVNEQPEGGHLASSYWEIYPSMPRDLVCVVILRSISIFSFVLSYSWVCNTTRQTTNLEFMKDTPIPCCDGWAMRCGLWVIEGMFYNRPPCTSMSHVIWSTFPHCPYWPMPLWHCQYGPYYLWNATLKNKILRLASETVLEGDPFSWRAWLNDCCK